MLKNKNFWNKLASISAYGGGTVLIVHKFFLKDIKTYQEVFLILEALSAIIFLIAELMKYIIKKRNK